MVDICTLQRILDIHYLHATQIVFQVNIGACFNHPGHICIRRSAMGRVVLETTICWGVMGGGNHDTVTLIAAILVVGKDGVGDHGCGRVVKMGSDTNVHPVGGQHLQGGQLGRPGEGVGIHAQE